MGMTVDASPRLDTLQAENSELKQRLEKLETALATQREARRTRRNWLLRLLVPALDRHRVLRRFEQLLRTASAFAGPRAKWPASETLSADGEAFATALLRFWLRRRIGLALLSLVALAVPTLQLVVMRQQNRIIANQTSYQSIQLYDTVARSMTAEDPTAKQMTGALLAQTEPELLAEMLEPLFASEFSGALTATSAAQGNPLRLNEAAARGHLVGALALSLQRHPELSPQARETARAALVDAGQRVGELLLLLRQPHWGIALRDEVHRYLFQLGVLMRSLAAHPALRSSGEYAVLLKPFLRALKSLEPASPPDDPTRLLRAGLRDLCVSLGLEGEGSPSVKSLARGRKTLQQALALRPADWKALRRWIDAR